MVIFCRNACVRLILAVMLLRTGSLLFGASDSYMEMPPPLAASSKITNKQLLEKAQPLLPKGAFIGPLLDEEYAVIKYEWLNHDFLPYYKRRVEQLKKIASITAESSDCDNFALFLRHLIGMAAIVGRTAEPAAAQVIVFQSRAFSKVGSTRERHMVGLILTDSGWVVLEPQNAEKLSPLETYPNKRELQYMSFH